MKHFTLFICTILLCGCMAEEQFDIPAKPPKVHDNLAISDSYYWFNGNKEPLQKMTEYSFVITEEDAADVSGAHRRWILSFRSGRFR